jgi:actin-related protein 9
MAQLGCGELSPPHHRIPTRMFRDAEDQKLWRPYHTYKRVTSVDGLEIEEWVEDVDEDKGAVWPIEGMFVCPQKRNMRRRRKICI